MTISTHSKAKAGETPTARQRRVWDKMAPAYDKQIALFERIQFGGGREWVCSRAFGSVLEVAIGTGRNLPFYPAEAHITGIELSPAMLAITRQRATDLGIDADLREGDAEALPFADNSFDTGRVRAVAVHHSRPCEGDQRDGPGPQARRQAAVAGSHRQPLVAGLGGATVPGAVQRAVR
jgi:SAM-dependent methyltransferase